MAKQIRTTLKGYFQTGNIPVEQHYIDFIDSTLNISEKNSGNIDLTGNISMSGNISSSGITGTHTLGGDVFITGILSSSGEISSSGAFTGSGINILGDITASGNIKCGELALGGELSAVNTDFNYISGSRLTLGTGEAQLSLGGTILTTTFAELNYLDGLTSAEATQIKNIDSNAISNAEWGYVAGMNQSVATTDSPTFAALNIGKVAKGGIGTYGGSIVVPSGGKAFTFTLTSIPTIAGINSGQISKTAPTLIQNASVGSTDAIIINCINQQLSATAFGQSTATAASTPGFYINISNDASTDFTAGTAQFTVVIL